MMSRVGVPFRIQLVIGSVGPFGNWLALGGCWLPGSLSVVPFNQKVISANQHELIKLTISVGWRARKLKTNFLLSTSVII